MRPPTYHRMLQIEAALWRLVVAVWLLWLVTRGM